MVSDEGSEDKDRSISMCEDVVSRVVTKCGLVHMFNSALAAAASSLLSWVLFHLGAYPWTRSCAAAKEGRKGGIIVTTKEVGISDVSCARR